MPMLRPMRSCCPSTSKSAANAACSRSASASASRLRPAGRDQREFVAADPREDRALGGRLQPLGYRSQQRIPDRMSENVVDLLEAVEVDAQDGEALAARARPRERRRQMLGERRPVGQMGQRIVTRHIGDLRFGVLALGNVLGQGQQISRLPGFARNEELLGVEYSRCLRPRRGRRARRRPPSRRIPSPRGRARAASPRSPAETRRAGASR